MSHNVELLSVSPWSSMSGLSCCSPTWVHMPLTNCRSGIVTNHSTSLERKFCHHSGMKKSFKETKLVLNGFE